MKILQFDSIGGASGDMILAALIDLGVNRDELQRQLQSLAIKPFELRVETATGDALRGLRVEVLVADDHQPAGTEARAHHHHRGLREILDIIRRAALAEEVKQAGIRVFQRLAEAEARAHGTSVEQVHLHAVGAADSIIDIVGACLALRLLGAEAVALGPLPMGYGVTECAHGVIPIPAPATVELLRGFPVTQTDEPFELVTPTGAALLTTWKTMERPPDGSRILGVGHGFGRRKLNRRPNVLRALLLESDATGAGADECLVLECAIDDTIPELIGSLVERLMEAGALDAYTTPIQMKKQRPGILLTVLCRFDQREVMLELIFRESTTFGIRIYPVRRAVLERRHETVDTPYGKIRIKVGRWQGRDITHAPEHDDCRRAADAARIAVRTVYEAALRATAEGC